MIVPKTINMFLGLFTSFSKFIFGRTSRFCFIQQFINFSFELSRKVSSESWIVLVFSLEISQSNTTKGAFTVDISCSSNSYVSLYTSLIFPHENFYRNLYNITGKLEHRNLLLVPCINFLMVRKFRVKTNYFGIYRFSNFLSSSTPGATSIFFEVLVQDIYTNKS